MSDGLWKNILKELESRLSEQVVETWFRPLKYLAFENNQLLMEAPHRFFRDWIEENYLDTLTEAAREVLGDKASVRLLANSDESFADEVITAPPINGDAPPPVPRTMGTPLNPLYTFENFVVGQGNQFAFAASEAVANNPARDYNPLFIYGGVGLGKTHLLNAIGNRILVNRPDACICYMTSEKFTNEMINSIRYRKIEEFRERFRTVDVLLIDDIQFIAGKERTMEEFFHTFNELYNSHRQIVVTSDKLPKEIPDLEERLRSRFEWGLIADIQPPDMETKVAILRKKAELLKINLPDDVAFYLASQVKSNIRELEGSLKRLRAYSSLGNREISLELAREVLAEFVDKGKKIVSPDLVIKTVANHYQVKLSDIRSAKKHKVYSFPRQVAMYLLRQYTELSLPEIGQKLGGRDHTTVLHGIRKIESRLKEDHRFRAELEKIRATIEG
ncbi:MAG: chromosomal replication initiator protein DnaA [Deltaproteobacteria bacterium]|nr:MAG: chromosomal replication initiator protein DnaA [Deltaproteobacteria bacterium]